MVLTDEEKKERKRIYYQENKEKILNQRKLYRENNIEKIKEKDKQRYQDNIEKILKQNKLYRKTPEGIKSLTISRWKLAGLIYEDYESLYGHYLNANNCDECGIKFGKYGGGVGGDWKCMDHCHETGAFRNFLCCKCNLSRG